MVKTDSATKMAQVVAEDVAQALSGTPRETDRIEELVLREVRHVIALLSEHPHCYDNLIDARDTLDRAASRVQP